MKVLIQIVKSPSGLKRDFRRKKIYLTKRANFLKSKMCPIKQTNKQKKYIYSKIRHLSVQ